MSKLVKVRAPDHKVRLGWDFILLLCTFQQIVELPLNISFSLDTTFVLINNYVVFSVYMFDIVLNFNTGFYQKGKLVTDRLKIIGNYLRGWFFFDFISSLPYDSIHDYINEHEYLRTSQTMIYFENFKVFQFLNSLRLLRIMKLSKIYQKLEERLFYSNSFVEFNKVLKLICTVFLTAHWLGCFWHLVVIFEVD